MKQVIAHIDDDGAVVGYSPLDAHRTLGKEWVAQFQEGMRYLVSLDMPKQCWQVYGVLISELTFDNWIRVNQMELAGKLHYSRRTITAALRYLIDADVIAKGPMAGHCNTYRLNPRIAHKGAQHYKNNVVQYDDLRTRKRRCKS